jgi:hypothetical protein
LTQTAFKKQAKINRTRVYCGDRRASYWNSLSVIATVIAAENSANDTAAVVAKPLGSTVSILLVVAEDGIVAVDAEPLYGVPVLSTVVSFCACTYDAQTDKTTTSTSMPKPFIFA